MSTPKLCLNVLWRYAGTAFFKALSGCLPAVLTLPLVLFALCLLSPAADLWAAQEKTAKEWSDLIHDRYINVETMTASFTQVMLHKESGVEEEREGELFFQKPLLVNWHTQPPFEELILLGKEHIWHYFPDEELAYKFSLEAVHDQSGFILVITGQTRLDDRFTVVPQELDEGLMKLHLIPLEPSQSLVEADIWIEPETGLIKRLLIVDFYANTSEISLSNEKFGVRIAADKFRFTPPKGTEVEDNTIQHTDTGRQNLAE